jgi:Flp pilus assembly secretin CpaC
MKISSPSSNPIPPLSPSGARYSAAEGRARLFSSALAGALCCLALTVPTQAQSSVTATSPTSAVTSVQGDSLVELPLDREAEIALDKNSTFEVVQGASVVRVRPRRGDGATLRLGVEPRRAGVARIVVRSANGTEKFYLVRVGGISGSAASTSPSTSGDVPTAPSATHASPLVPLPALSPGAAGGSSGAQGLPGGLTAEMPVEVSPIVPQPARLGQAREVFPSVPTWTAQRQAATARARNTGRTISVAQGLARFLSFRQNIISVFFSDDVVMDARAMNARTVALTGKRPGRSTMAIFVAQGPNDVVGRAEIFTIVVEPATPSVVQPTPDAGTLEVAIRSAINDPRVGVRVIRQPNGSFAAALTGTLRNSAEIEAAKETAGLFLPADQVISSLYLDPSAPTLAQIANPVQTFSYEEVLQAKLRQITSNDTIELISLPTGLAVKAEVGSEQDAESLLRLLPTLNTRVLPFIVVRGSNASGANGSGTVGVPSAGLGEFSGEAAGRYYGADRPVLTGEDQEITRRMHEVTGVRSVYAVRTALNAIALYGRVRDRAEYETLRRYAVMLPLIAGPAVQTAQSSTFSTTNGLPAGGTSVGGAAGASTTNGTGALVSPILNANRNTVYNPQYIAGAQVTPGGTGAVTPGGPVAGGVDGGATGVFTPGTPGLGTGAAGGLGTGGLQSGLGGVGIVPGAGFGGGVSNVSSASSLSLPNVTYSGSAGQATGFVGPEPALRDPINAAQQPAAGYRQSVNVQMFVRVDDPRANQVRRVMAETSIVEISRTSLRNLGVQVGSATILSEDIQRGTPGTPPTIVTNPQTGQQMVTPGTAGTPDIIQRTIDPAVREGLATLGAGFAGGGPFGFLDPLRVRLNALYNNGNARILSRPNIMAVEGGDAQIVIGGERPVPSAVTSGQAVGQSIVFRRFGIILTMRPTLTDDDTIILQVRADITELADEFGINLNGALIPGERVRSVNTTLNVREGDTIVLGGLITNDRRQQTSRVPILSNIPILGSLFKSKRFENNESELAIFLTPRILRDTASLNTREAINRVPALPALPDAVSGAAAFNVLGEASVR